MSFGIRLVILVGLLERSITKLFYGFLDLRKGILIVFIICLDGWERSTRIITRAQLPLNCLLLRVQLRPNFAYSSHTPDARLHPHAFSPKTARYFAVEEGRPA